MDRRPPHPEEDSPTCTSGAPVPLIERCPECARPVGGWSCKVYCLNPGCALYRRVLENCAGD